MDQKVSRIIQRVKERRSPLIARIMLINLVSLLVLSVFNYVAFYNTTNRAFMESVVAYNERVSELAFGNIDRQIVQKVAGVPSLFFSDIRANEAILLPQTVDISNSPTLVRGAVAKIEEIFSACPVARSIDIYYEGTNTIFTGRGNLHTAQNDDQRDLYLPWYKQFVETGKQTVFLGLTNAVYPVQDIGAVFELDDYSESIVSFITRIQNPKWRDKGIVVAIHISPRGFSEYIDEQAGQLIIEGADGRIVYSSAGKETEPTLVTEAASAQEKSTFQLEERNLVVSQSKNNPSGIRYYYSIPYQMFFKDYNSNLQVLIMNYLFSVVVTLGVLLLISHFSNHAYRKRLVSLSKRAGLEVSENPETFDRSVDVLTSHLSSLNTAVQKTRPVLYRNHVRSLILGRQSSEAFAQLEPLLGESLQGVFAMIVHLLPAESTALDLDLLQDQLQGVTGGCPILMTTLEQNEIAMVIAAPEEQLQEVRGALNKQLDSLFTGHYVADGQWFASADKPEQSFKVAFESATLIARYHFIFPEKSRLHYQQIGPVQVKDSGSHLKFFADIEKNLLSENLLDLRQRLYALTESFKLGNYSIDYCSSTLRDLVTLLYNITLSSQLDMLLTFGYDIRAHYRQITDIDEFYRWSCELCEVLMQNIRQRKKSIDPDLCSRIVGLIDLNLENDISLEFLADNLGLRPDVLSRMFKQLMEKSYTDYIKERKFARAKELIMEGHSIKEVALRLGYNSTQYFIKIFKESFGVTPYQYKKSGMPIK